MVGSIRSGLMGGPRLSGIRFRTPRALREIEPGRSSLRELEQQVSVLRVALQRLIEGAGIRSTEGSATAAEAKSRRPLGLDYEPTFTTLQSLEEVNTTATSYSPFGPDFSGTSTSLPTVGGIYSGANADDTLTFTVKNAGTIGANGKRMIEIFDGTMTKIDEAVFTHLAPDTPVTLSNGLTLSLSAGDIVKNDTFTVSVSASIGSAVDPSKPFNGTRNDNPNLEAGQSVTTGSFEVNGATISVLDTDSIDSILSRITASAAGVTASFDTATEQVMLAQKTPGSAPPIVLSNDTSGFLEATKLSGASQIPGTDGDPARVLSSVSALSGIRSGDFRINGVTITLDTAADSLDDVIARINSSEAGVTATLIGSADTLYIVSISAASDLVLEAGSSGFLSALQLGPGTHTAGQAGTSTREFESSGQVRKNLLEVEKQLDAIFAKAFKGVPPELLDPVRTRLQDTLSEAFKRILGVGGERLGSGFGIDFDLVETGRGVCDFDLDRFERALSDDFDRVCDFLFREPVPGTQAGLIVSLIGALEGIQTDLQQSSGSGSARGLLIGLSI